MKCCKLSRVLFAVVVGGGVGSIAVVVLGTAVVVMTVPVVVALVVDDTDAKVEVPRMTQRLRRHSFLHLLNTIQHLHK